ncbi:MAG: hypothetical protein IK062_05430 [Selenomonadaceae bacterium]|nr:hypothetical protein [Selenomonadaceae bacterium]
MARQYKKILKKIKPKEKKVESAKKDKKSWSYYILAAFLALTAVVMVLGWENFTNINRGLYVFLTTTLAINFARRTYDLTPTQDLWAERASYATMAVATVLFGLNIYVQHING